MSKIFEDNSQTIDSTPLVHLNRVAKGRVLADRARSEASAMFGAGSVPTSSGSPKTRRADQGKGDPSGFHQRQHGHCPGIRGCGPRLSITLTMATHEPRAPQSCSRPGCQPWY